jgi:hypothetical protein
MQHTLGHSKALALMLLNATEVVAPTKAAVLPRNDGKAIKEFKDLQTWLIASGDWRGTLTANDVEYSMKAGHASGGALSFLWHAKVGTLLTASMSKYQLVENFNMQRDKDPFSIALTPRFDVVINSILYSNIHDLKAKVSFKEHDGVISFEVNALLVDENQQSPATGSVACTLRYTFTADGLTIKGNCGDVKGLIYQLPLIATKEETIEIKSSTHLEVKKAKCQSGGQNSYTDHHR